MGPQDLKDLPRLSHLVFFVLVFFFNQTTISQWLKPIRSPVFTTPVGQQFQNPIPDIYKVLISSLNLMMANLYPSDFVPILSFALFSLTLLVLLMENLPHNFLAIIFSGKASQGLFYKKRSFIPLITLGNNYNRKFCQKVCHFMAADSTTLTEYAQHTISRPQKKGCQLKMKHNVNRHCSGCKGIFQ